MSDMFKFAGVSRTDGVLKTRFVNDNNALKLIKKNDTNADMVELPVPMSKINAINYLMEIKFHMVNDEIDTEVHEALSERLQYLTEKERLARGEFKPKGRKSTDGEVKQNVVVIKEPDPILAPHGWKKDGTPKAAPGRKAGSTTTVKAPMVIKEPDPILAPYGWKKDGTPKAKRGRKSTEDSIKTGDAVTLQSIFMKKAENATTVDDPSLEDAPF